MKTTISSIFIAAILVSCGNGNNEVDAIPGEVTSSAYSNASTDESFQKELEALEQEEEKRVQALEKTLTSLKYDKLIHDFGKVKQGSENTTRFTVTNTGDKPLIISDVSASCGCTLPKKPEAPIAPGKSDVIEVTFKPKPGQANEITKTVTVTANTNPAVSKLEIKAFVTE